MSPKDKALKAIHDLVAACNDAAEGYAKAAKGVHDGDLSDWLAAASADRERFASELNHELRRIGEQPRLDLHEGGILHKGWVDLEQRLRSTAEHLHSKDDTEILRECIAGDTGTLHHYDHALAQDLTSDLRDVVVEQKTVIEDNLVYLENRVTHKRHHTA
jgi:uncharacterized protein (TIGR02284 family)